MDKIFQRRLLLSIEDLAITFFKIAIGIFAIQRGMVILRLTLD